MKIRRILALLCACLFVFSLTSCSDNGDNAPEGMKTISADNVEYKFYVYSNWLVDDGVTDCAYFSATDRSNVSMSSYLPAAEHTTATDFYEAMKATYKRDFNNFEIVEDGKTTKLGGYDAFELVYTFSFGESNYKVYQAITLRGSIMYTFTYTSSPELYDSHLEEALGMLKAVEFAA